MSRPSTIDQLPPECRELIGRLREQGCTLDTILTKLEELDADVSRSALGRHVQKIDKIGERMRQSRAVADALVQRFGDAPESRVARLNIELMHGVIMRLVTAEGVDDEDGEGVTLDAKEAMFVAGALKDLASAAKSDADLIVKLRQEVAKEAAKAVDAEGKAAGLTAETIDAIKARILGVGK